MTVITWLWRLLRGQPWLWVGILLLALAGCESRQDKIDRTFDACWRVTIDKAPEGVTVMVWVDTGGIASETHRAEAKTLDAALDETLAWIDEKKSQSP